MSPRSAPNGSVLALVPRIDTVVDSVDMPTETQFNKLKARVGELEDAQNAGPTSFVHKHPTLAWALAIAVPTVLAVGAVVVTVFVGLLPHLENDAVLRIKNQVTESLQEPSQKIGRMSDDIAEIKGTLKAWAPLMTAQFFKRAATLPDKQFMESLPQLKAVAQVARESKSEVAAKDISEIGKRTIALAVGHSDSSTLAWETTTSLLQYRSALNSLAPPPNLGDEKPISYPRFTTQYSFKRQLGFEAPLFGTVGTVPRDQAAVMDYIGHDLNAKLAVGNALLIGRGGTFQLDNMHMKNVVLINVHVVYEGGPIILENVYFMDCTFEIKRGRNSQAFSARLIEPAPTNYSLPAS